MVVCLLFHITLFVSWDNITLDFFTSIYYFAFLFFVCYTGETPHTVTLFAFDDLVDSVRPGDRIEVSIIDCFFSIYPLVLLKLLVTSVPTRILAVIITFPLFLLII